MFPAKRSERRRTTVKETDGLEATNRIRTISTGTVGARMLVAGTIRTEVIYSIAEVDIFPAPNRLALNCDLSETTVTANKHFSNCDGWVSSTRQTEKCSWLVILKNNRTNCVAGC